MKYTLPSLAVVGVLAGFFYGPKPALAQSKEYNAITGLSRDITDLTRKIDELKAGQAERQAQTETLIKQLMETNATLALQLKTLQESVGKNQADQERRVFAPLERMKTDVEELSRDFAGVGLRLETMSKQQDSTKSVTDDIFRTVKLVLTQTEQVAPPPAPVSAAPPAANPATLLLAEAQRERVAGDPNFALQAFLEVSQKYPTSPEAPMALFEMGSMYAANGQYAEALTAFDRVLEQFPENPVRKNAQFKKAEQLASLGRRADAAKEYSSFAKQYPSDDKAAEARERAKALTAPPPAAAKPKPAAKGKSR